MHLHEDLSNHRLLILCIRITDTMFSNYEPVVIDLMPETMIEVEADVVALPWA